MSDKPKKTESQAKAEAMKAARTHDLEIEQLRAEGATAKEIADVYQRHQREEAEILGSWNQPIVGRGLRNA